MKTSSKVAIVTINKNQYSETFIRAQIENIPASLVLYGDWFPTYYGEGKLIQSKVKRIISKVFYKILKIDVFTKEQELFRLLKRNEVNSVIAQYGISGAHFAPFCEKYKIKLFVHFHGFDASRFDILEEYQDGYSKMFNVATKIVVVSDVMKKKIMSLGCHQNKIELIHYGPSDLFFNSCPKYTSSNFFSIGRFVDKKAPYLTILAFYFVQQEFEGAKLIMAGDGELLNICKILAQSLNLVQNIEFVGVITPYDTLNFLEKSIAYVQHSIVAPSGDSEGTPLAILEAQAAAIPVISTRHAGIPDVVIHGHTGLLVEEKDIHAMAAEMKNVLVNRQFAKELGQNARVRIKRNFTMTNYINKLKEII